jgi:hypothetical protein
MKTVSCAHFIDYFPKGRKTLKLFTLCAPASTDLSTNENGFLLRTFPKGRKAA